MVCWTYSSWASPYRLVEYIGYFPLPFLLRNDFFSQHFFLFWCLTFFKKWIFFPINFFFLIFELESAVGFFGVQICSFWPFSSLPFFRNMFILHHIRIILVVVIAGYIWILFVGSWDSALFFDVRTWGIVISRVEDGFNFGFYELSFPS